MEVDRSIARYSKCRRKDPQQEKNDASEDVYNTRKNFHRVMIEFLFIFLFQIHFVFQLALQYYSRLNQLQSSRHIALLNPILSLVTASKSHYQLGCDSLSGNVNETFLSNVGIKLKR